MNQRAQKGAPPSGVRVVSYLIAALTVVPEVLGGSNFTPSVLWALWAFSELGWRLCPKAVRALRFS